MPDGITLSARVWRPVCDMRVPAIIEALPYRKRDGTAARDAGTHTQFVQSGYVCLRIDLRGNGESDGLFDDEYSPQELNDIYAAIAWIADQDWCTGSVGIMGISWGGFNGLQVAAMQPPALKAVITCCSTVDRYADDIHYKGGCLLGANIAWAATAMSWFSTPPDPMLMGNSWRTMWLDRLRATPNLIDTWMRHPNRDDYWRHGSVCEDYSRINAAVLAIGGWHDGYRNTPSNLLAGLSSPVKAIMGPWNHKYPHLGMPEPKIDFVTEALRWWNHWLKGADTGVANDPAYRAYVMDSIGPAKSYDHRPGKWVGLDGLSSPEIEPWTLHLAGASLSETATDTRRSVQTDTRCGEGSGQYFPFGFGPGELPDDQQDDDERSMCFDTTPLSAAKALLGAPTLNVRVQSKTPRAQIAVRLSDVHPDGTATLISHGFLNLRHRTSFEFPQDLEPDVVYDVAVVLDQCAYAVPAGHRLRIAISPSYWPFIWPEAVATVLTVTGGTLGLSVLQTGAAAYTGFTPARPHTPNPVTQKTTGPERQEWSVENGTHTLLIEADHGLSVDETHGLESSSSMREVWQIDEGDPASARCAIEWVHGMGRDDWQITTRCKMTLRGDVSQFFVTGELTAFEDETEVFVRSFTETVPR